MVWMDQDLPLHDAYISSACDPKLHGIETNKQMAGLFRLMIYTLVGLHSDDKF